VIIVFSEMDVQPQARLSHSCLSELDFLVLGFDLLSVDSVHLLQVLHGSEFGVLLAIAEILALLDLNEGL